MKQNMIYWIVFLLIGLLNTIQAQWQRVTMPAGRSGAVYSVCVKDSNIFVGTPAGIYLTKDNGLHWIKVNPILLPRNFLPRAVSLVANDKYIIASLSDAGIYLSSNDGASWENTGLGAGEGSRTSPLEVAVSGNWIIAGHPLTYSIFLSYQSNDNGINWNTNIPQGILSIAIQDSIALIVTSNGILNSSDCGVSWNNVYPSSFIVTNRGSSIALSGSRAFAGIGKIPWSTIYSTTDAGLTWTDSINLNCTSINSIIISPVGYDYNFVFAGTDSGVFRSSDNGKNWISKNNGLTSSLIFSLAFKQKGTNNSVMLIAGTGDGLFFSTDFGESWNVMGSPSDWKYVMSGSNIFARMSKSSYKGYSKNNNQPNYAFQSAVYRSIDEGLNWNKKFSDYLEKNAEINSMVINSENILFAGCMWSRPNYADNRPIVFASSDIGENWSIIYLDSTSNYPSLATKGSFVFMSLYGALYRSSDNGNNWEKYDTLKVPIGYQDSYAVNPLLTAFSLDGDKIYAGGSDKVLISHRPPTVVNFNYIVISNDNGTIWTSLDSQIPTGKIRYSSSSYIDTISVLSCLHGSGSHILAGMKAQYFNGPLYTYRNVNGGGLYHLYNNGSSWTLLDSSFMNQSIFSFKASGNYIFVGTESGVYRSSNFGTNWQMISSDLNFNYTSSLEISDSYLYASTSNGLWKLPLLQATIVDNYPDEKNNPAIFSLSQNYPNPFNPTTQIDYTISEKGFITLKVYNLLGQEVATIFSGVQQAGNFTATFDGKGLSSGIYFYRLKAGAFSETKKFVLLR